MGKRIERSEARVSYLPSPQALFKLRLSGEHMRAVLPFPVLKLDAGEQVVPPREYTTIRRPETLAA